jgi:hypothetical protein
VRIQSLPGWCIEWRLNIDIARKLIRRRPDLQALGKQVGATRVYDESDAAKIRAALAERAGAKGVASGA